MSAPAAGKKPSRDVLPAGAAFAAAGELAGEGTASPLPLPGAAAAAASTPAAGQKRSRDALPAGTAAASSKRPRRAAAVATAGKLAEEEEKEAAEEASPPPQQRAKRPQVQQAALAAAAKRLLPVTPYMGLLVNYFWYFQELHGGLGPLSAAQFEAANAQSKAAQLHHVSKGGQGSQHTSQTVVMQRVLLTNTAVAQQLSSTQREKKQYRQRRGDDST